MTVMMIHIEFHPFFGANGSTNSLSFRSIWFDMEDTTVRIFRHNPMFTEWFSFGQTPWWLCLALFIHGGVLLIQC